MATPQALASEFADRYMEACKAAFEEQQNLEKKKLKEKLAKDLEVQLVLGQQHETAEDGKRERPTLRNPN
ncbi:hypothetical protein MKX03_026824 [Papaver bracteatum]|nr:hypothetical protein MKX03_026824 [Papaver bracteatum]